MDCLSLILYFTKRIKFHKTAHNQTLTLAPNWFFRYFSQVALFAQMKCEISEVWPRIIATHLRSIEALFALHLFLSTYIYIVHLADSCKPNTLLIHVNGFGGVSLQFELNVWVYWNTKQSSCGKQSKEYIFHIISQ
jgi:hypothetical protein